MTKQNIINHVRVDDREYGMITWTDAADIKEVVHFISIGHITLSMFYEDDIKYFANLLTEFFNKVKGKEITSMEISNQTEIQGSYYCLFAYTEHGFYFIHIGMVTIRICWLKSLENFTKLVTKFSDLIEKKEK